ncbi:unnamed protein product [Didymodactylos carnosus]|uniref:C2H2-type domain-containing protein n=1 Tax=Didymodactylos carnosus TaxID=1234261 RepID=A0A814CUM7_9BILA|nr:unnamed protein product [Didymodactylos carnosus]CAF3720855.1 unnamed protein product [Didymodactylos carnosus]
MCGISYRTFSGYKTHVHRHHAQLLQTNSMNIFPSDYDNADDQVVFTMSNDDDLNTLYGIDDDLSGSLSDNDDSDAHKRDKITLDDIQKTYAKFLLQVREEFILPQKVIQSISSNIVSLFDSVTELIMQETETNQNRTTTIKNNRAFISKAFVYNIIQEVVHVIDKTTKNECEYFVYFTIVLLDRKLLISQFIRLCEKFFNYLPPQEIQLSKSGEEKEFAYYVPITQSLTSMLNKEDMIPLLQKNIQWQQHQTTLDNDLMYSYRHGKNGQHIDDNSFLIQLYVDDIGLTNPIGPKKDQHKMTMFYFLLEDIPDMFRSPVQCINLVGICNSKYLNDQEKSRQFFKPIIDDLNDFQTNGLFILTFNRVLHFSFSTISANNLAANEIGGFQRSFSTGHFCRPCLLSYNNRATPLTDITIIQRNENKHEQYLQQLSNDPYIRSIYGVVGPSVFQALPGFHSVKSLPGDLMHDFLEGVCPIVIIAMLKEASSEKLLTYAQIQKTMQEFEYGSLDSSDKPPVIQVKHLHNGDIVGSASQKFLLFRLFPVIFHTIVDKLKTFKVYILLREMLEMIMASPCRRSWLPYLQTLSVEFQCLMARLLPDHMIPKIHFVTEYAKICDDNGPPMKFWCMRYEAKHSYFKQIALRAKNFKNPPKMLATRYQLKQCLLLSKCNFLKNHEVGSGLKIINIQELNSVVRRILLNASGIDLLEKELLQCTSLYYDHVWYKQAAAYVYQLAHVEEIPLFFQIAYIIKIQKKWMLIVDQLVTKQYDNSLCCWQLESHDSLELISPTDLEYYHKGLDIYEVKDREEIDGETLILMNDINKIKDLVPKYKHQLLFIREHEKLFKTVVLGISGRQNEAVTTMNMDEHVSNEPLCDRNVPSSSTENIPPSKSMQKKFPETYEYPDRRQYEAVSFAILKKLKKIWKETIQAKFKRQRRPLADIKQMKEKFSRPDNGRPIKKKTMILAERDSEKKVLIQSSNTDDEGEQEKRVQLMNDELEKSGTDWKMVLELWRSTLKSRRKFVNINRTDEILKKYPGYKIPVLIFAEMEMLIGVTIGTKVRSDLPALLEKLSPSPAFVTDQLPIRIIKVIARTFDESWHHTIRVSV